MQVVVIIPTYNESGNIGSLIDVLQTVFAEIPHDMRILVVDDNSPDGTAAVVQEAGRKHGNVQLLTGEKRGLGAAYVRGIRYALDQLSAEAIVQMDADFSHSPQDVPRLVAELDRGYDFVIGSRWLKGGKIPTEYIPAVEQGVREAAEGGVLAGYPMTDVSVTLLDGSFHEVDSSPMAFKMAGSMGFKEGVQRAGPVLLEPMMKVEVLVPDEAVGEITGDLASRRASIEGIEHRGGNTQVIQAVAPLAEMFGYATALRSLTQGRGVFTMEFDHYQEVEKKVSETLLAGVY